MIKQFAFICLLTIAIFGLLLYVFQRYLIYFPDKSKPLPENFQASDMQVVLIATSDGLELNSWYKPAMDNLPTVVYFHGNAGHIGHRMALARQLMNKGFGVLLLEYRGYGGNSGQPSEQGLYQDARAGVRFLQDKGVKPEQLVIYGESLGTGVATKMAEEHPSCALILQSPFTSLADVAHFHYPWILIKPTDSYDSLSRIPKIKVPVLILHGKMDKTVPFKQGLTLFEAANQPKEMVVIEDKDHNNLWDSTFSNHVIRFIQAHCL